MDNQLPDETSLSRKTFLKRTAVVAGGAAVASGLGGTVASAAPKRLYRGMKDTFLIGSIPPLTSFAAADGAEQRKAQILAVEQWNKTGGILGREIKLKLLDLGSMEPAKMITLLRQLTGKDKVDAVLTGYTYYGGVEYDMMAKTGVPYVNCNTNEQDATQVRKNPSKYWNVWQNDPTQKWYGLGFPAFVKDIEKQGFKPRKKTIAIVYSSDDYASTIAKLCKPAMEAAGWTVPLFEQVTSPVTEWGPVLAKIRGINPDIVFLSDATLGDAVSFTQQFALNPTQSLLYGQYIPSLPEYRQQAGKSADGVVWSSASGVLNTPTGLQFQKDYKKRWGTPPGKSIGGILYDCTNVYLTAVKKANTVDDRRKIIDTMVNSRPFFVGANGTYNWNKRDHTTFIYPEQVADVNKAIPHLYFQIQKGVQKIITPSAVQTSSFQTPPWFT